MENKNKHLNTVKLDTDKCKGCIACMKRCPTEAIRVRNGKAKVFYERCVACGECVRICQNRAKNAVYDSLDVIKGYEYKVALPSPSLFGQFNNLNNVNFVIEGLLEMGFDDVSEVAVGAEIITDAAKKYAAAITKKKPIISTACPAVVELIMIRFTNLKDNLLQLQAPVDIAAKLAREAAVKKTGLPSEKIGIFFISPCPAKVYALKSGLGVKKQNVDGVLSTSEIYFKLLPIMKKIENPRPLSEMGIKGLQWAGSGGEAIGFGKEKYIAADGIDNVMNILKALEDGKLRDVDFIELNACVGGCVGGVLNIENPFVAKSKLRSMRKYLEPRDNTLGSHNLSLKDVIWEKMPESHDVLKLDEDRFVAMKKLIEINKIYESLPQLDCGSCGAPSCRAFAEDVVNGLVDIAECIRKKDTDKEKEQELKAEIDRIYDILPKLDCGCCESQNCRLFAEDVASGRISIEDCVKRHAVNDSEDDKKDDIIE